MFLKKIKHLVLYIKSIIFYLLGANLVIKKNVSAGAIVVTNNKIIKFTDEDS
jgi:hypothetical protein